MLSAELQIENELNDIKCLEHNPEDFQSNFINYQERLKMIEMKNYILDSLFKITTYFNAYKFLKKDDMEYYREKASKKAAEIFMTIHSLNSKLSEISVKTAAGELSGEEIFESIYDRKNSNQMQAISLVEAAAGQGYSDFKIFLGNAASAKTVSY